MCNVEIQPLFSEEELHALASRPGAKAGHVKSRGRSRKSRLAIIHAVLRCTLVDIHSRGDDGVGADAISYKVSKPTASVAVSNPAILANMAQPVAPEAN